MVTKIVAKIQEYAKGLAAYAGLIALIVGTEAGEDSKWYVYLVAFFAASGVVLVKNKPAA